MTLATLALLLWAQYARLVRGQVLSVKERDFVALAEEGTHRRFDRGAVCTPELVEPEELFHPLKDQFHLPSCPIQPQHGGQAPIGRQGGRHDDPGGKGQRGR